MGIGLGVLLALGISGLYILAKWISFKRQSSSWDRNLKPLSKSTLELLRASDDLGNLVQNPRTFNVGWHEIAEIYKNGRIFVQAVDVARLGNPEDREEFEVLHSQVAEAHYRTVSYLWRASFERLWNAIFRNDSSLYALAAAWAYSKEAVVVNDLLDLCGDRRSTMLEEHI